MQFLSPIAATGDHGLDGITHNPSPPCADNRIEVVTGYWPHYAPRVADGVETMAFRIADMNRNLDGAVRTLQRIDRENPETEVSPEDRRANPYLRASGDNGQLDLDERDQVPSGLARKFVQAAAYDQGSIVVMGGGRDGWRDAILPASHLDLFKVGKLAQDVKAIAAKLDQDRNGTLAEREIPRDAIEAAVRERFSTRPESMRGRDTDLTRPFNSPRRLTDDFVAKVTDLVIAALGR